MKKAITQRHVTRGRILKALAHSSRLCIVDTLSRGPRCVHELRDVIGADEKQGAQVIYTLTAACLLKFLSCVEAVALHHARSRLREAGGRGPSGTGRR